MALFGSKKTTTKKAAAPKAVAEKTPATVRGGAVDTSIIRRPRLTEKAANLSTLNVYTFEVAPGAAKHDIMRAVTALYKVTPVRVNVVNVQGKVLALRTRRGTGTRNSLRKAYVYLKQGDTIDFAA